MFNKNKPQEPEDDYSEKRQYVRLSKHYIVSYHVKDDPGTSYDLTQLKNISEGGICFVTTKSFVPGTSLVLRIKTPFMTESTHLEGETLESKEKLKDLIYETRLKFTNLDTEGQVALKTLMEYLVNNKGKNE